MTDQTQPLQTSVQPHHESGFHPVNVGHLVMGVAFLGLTIVWALVASDAVEGADIRWLLPIPWVAAGIAGVLATVIPARRHRPHTQTGWVTDPATEAPAETATETATEPTTETATEENR